MPWPRRASAAGACLVATLAISTIASAQRGGRFFRDATAGHDNPRYDGRLTFTRVRFSSSASWNHDYPDADRHLPLILHEVTALRPRLDGSNILDLEDPEIFKQPILYVWEPGYWRITPEAARNLRAYLLKGGFAIFDDFEGHHLDNLMIQLQEALPGARAIPLDLSHPVYHSFFDMERIDIPHPSMAVPPAFYGVFEDNDPNGRMLALLNHNSDIAEYWEWSGTGRLPVDTTNDAYKVGVNYFIYALTH